ncbi:hypothetical protein NCLIV_047770, partial [Neospora caninum Liverpool]
ASSHVSSSQPEEDDVGVGECFFRTISILLFTLIAAVSARAAWCLPLLYVVVALDEEKAIGIDGTFLSLSQLAEESLCLGESIVGFVVLILFPLLVPFAHLLASCLAMFITLLLRLLHPGPRSRRLPRTGGSRIKRWCRTLGLPILLKHLLSYMLSLSQFLTCWAMADVFALGLFTAYFTINAVHILVARIPAVSPSTPAFASSFSCLSSSLLSPCRLFSRFLPLESALPFGSGFWASMVFGASASQLHHLLPSQDEAKEGGEFLPSLAGERQALEAFAGEISDTENAVGPSPVCLFEANTKGRGAGSTSGVRRGPPEEGPAVFGRLGVVLTLIVALYAWPAEKPRHLDLDKINETVVLYYPAISQGARPLIPASIGNCTADSPEPPPEPCVGHNFLYHSRNAYYETTARWVSGVNTTDIEEIRLSGRDPQRETARREGEDPFCITDFHVSPLTINESVLGLFSVTVATITEAVERELTRLIQAYLEPDNNFIPWDKDTRISLQALVNHLAVVNAPGGLLCRPSPGTSTSLFDTQAKPRETSEAETHEEF